MEMWLIICNVFINECPPLMGRSFNCPMTLTNLVFTICGTDKESVLLHSSSFLFQNWSHCLSQYCSILAWLFWNSSGRCPMLLFDARAWDTQQVSQRTVISMDEFSDGLLFGLYAVDHCRYLPHSEHDSSCWVGCPQYWWVEDESMQIFQWRQPQ